MNEFVLLVLFGYIIPGSLLALVLFASKNAGRRDETLAAAFPLFNLFGYMVPFFYIVNYDNTRTEVNAYLKPILSKIAGFSFLEEESKEELDKARKELEQTIQEAKLKYIQQKADIKQKSEKRKLCSKLGLTLDDLESIKANRKEITKE